MKLVKDVGVVVTYDNVLSSVRLVKNSYELEITEELVESVEVVYWIYSFGWCDIVSVYNYIQTFIDDYNSFSTFEKNYCLTIGIFGSESFSDDVKKAYILESAPQFRKSRSYRLCKIITILSYGQEQEDVEIGYTEFEEFGERYVMINSGELITYFNSVGFQSNPIYTLVGKTEAIEILEI